MKKAIKRQSWCDLPDRKTHMRDTEDLYKVGARVDAWRSFLGPTTVKKLKRIKGNVVWFNKWEHFDKLICEFDCTEKQLRRVIESLLRPGHEVPDFLRNDIYDARAWASVPLNYFVEEASFNPRAIKKPFHWEILEAHEVPLVQFGIELPWVVSRNCFSLAHRLKGDGRFAEMSFAHPQLDARFENRRFVADGIFRREATRKEMEEALFAKVEIECHRCLVTIQPEEEKV